MLRLRSTAATLALASFVALGPLATDMYLPALPAMATALNATPAQAQLTLSVYMIAIALAQLVYGPLSDRFGRKPPLLVGLVLFTLASLACALAQSIEAVIAFRFLQALGGSAGPVLGRAAVRDVHGPLEAARILSYLGAATALAPALAPIGGGYLLAAFGWPSVFIFLAAYGLAATALLWLALPEPLAPAQRQSIHLHSIVRNYRFLLRHREFVGYMLACAFTFAGLFAFLSGAAFVLIEFLGISAQHFGYYFTLAVGGYITGTLFAGRLSRRLGINRLLLIGGVIATLGGALMAALALAQIFTALAVMLPMMLYMIGVGIVLPQSTAGAIGPFPQIAGSASALLGMVQMSIAAAAGILVGHLHSGTPLAMAAIIALMGTAGLASFFGLVWLPGRALQECSVKEV
ncbi:multidrug effflux MFS transporter [Nitrococcus mobilis]|uniref:Bcr/CflA family efflux transporter n=1 Tax=Nitrococcus mobilis Nb-231 TaxID=314278 RepID=A4BUQ4_9GAMM|nr:multidrug effflux MFS transporter [Nitrococcus mobilis]EAR20508.1 Permease of the major facilitator superfamily protein [Nitrococcus mobilis Nb-231]